MADPHDRKPDPPDDDGLYELAEDPDAAVEPSSPPPPGLRDASASSPAGNDRLDPMLDDPEPSAEAAGMKTGSGGKGAASHFSGDDPDYVNPEIARMRREEARIKAAEEEAAADAKKKTLLMVVSGVVVAVLVVAYFVLF